MDRIISTPASRYYRQSVAQPGKPGPRQKKKELRGKEKERCKEKRESEWGGVTCSHKICFSV